MGSSVIIVAGGSGVRMGGSIKKEFALIGSRPVLYHAVKPFLDTQLFNSIVVVINESLKEKASQLLSPCFEVTGKEILSYVNGGSSRRESVLNGLLSLQKESPDVVLIHDGARPWITKDVIQAVLSKTQEKGAAIPVIPAVNALKEIDREGKILRSINRDTAVGAQTPQGFLYSKILSAHLLAEPLGKDYADDAEIWQEFVGAVYTVPGNMGNKKITYKEDLEEKQ